VSNPKHRLSRTTHWCSTSTCWNNRKKGCEAAKNNTSWYGSYQRIVHLTITLVNFNVSFNFYKSFMTLRHFVKFPLISGTTLKMVIYSWHLLRVLVVFNQHKKINETYSDGEFKSYFVNNIGHSKFSCNKLCSVH
jgi:hypothetical protein